MKPLKRECRLNSLSYVELSSAQKSHPKYMQINGDVRVKTRAVQQKES